jgi:hypothetical protein
MGDTQDNAPVPQAEPSAAPPANPDTIDALIAEELERGRAGERRASGSRWWILALGLLLALGTALAYNYKRSHESDPMELLEFASLYLTAPLVLSVICIFAYFKYGRY